MLPCTEQLRAKDLRLRLDVARPALDRLRRAQRAELRGRRPDCPVTARPRRVAVRPGAGRRRAAELDPDGPVPDHLHERHRGRAQGRRARPALPRRPARCRPSTGSTRAPGELVWCTAASGWSKSARNVFIAPWMRGAAALLHDARFDPDERLELLEREHVDVLCMAPTEYRVIAKRAEPRPVAVAARPRRRRRGAQPRGAARVPRGHGPVDPRRLRPDRDRADHRACRSAASRVAGLDGPPAARASTPGSRTASCARPAHASRRSSSVPARTLRGDDGRSRPPDGGVAHRRPRHAGRGRLPALRGPRRRRDHLAPATGSARSRSSRRWSRTPPSPRPPWSPRPTTSAARWCARSSSCATATRRPTRWRASCRTTSRRQTAPYKYPRIVDFADELPKTASGKVRRAALRQ